MKKKLIINNEKIEVNISKIDTQSGLIHFDFEGQSYSFSRKSHASNKEVVLSNEDTGENSVLTYSDTKAVIDGLDVNIQDDIYKRDGLASADGGSMTSPMPGKILKVFVKVDDNVKSGEPLVVMEAMKMEHTIKASSAGKVSMINCEEGQLVDGGLALVEIQEES
tara:strand:+ start:281348 stop:281842 length:495 start_codon:yes stop_codon:yes gene_type:complete